MKSRLRETKAFYVAAERLKARIYPPRAATVILMRVGGGAEIFSVLTAALNWGAVLGQKARSVGIRLGSSSQRA
ncbi:MAG: hypothetical protein ACLTQI_00515 [Slackia sp.]